MPSGRRARLHRKIQGFVSVCRPRTLGDRWPLARPVADRHGLWRSRTDRVQSVCYAIRVERARPPWAAGHPRIGGRAAPLATGASRGVIPESDAWRTASWRPLFHSDASSTSSKFQSSSCVLGGRPVAVGQRARETTFASIGAMRRGAGSRSQAPAARSVSADVSRRNGESPVRRA